MKNITISQLLAFEEGFSSKPYYCSEGYPTIGIGTKIGRKGDPLECYTLTVDMNTAEAMLESELKLGRRYLESKFNGMDCIVGRNIQRIIILESMAYQLGTSGLDKFKRMWEAIEGGNWETAYYEALDSRWAKQTPERAKRHAEVLRTGDWSVYNGLI